jgi:hypothetical protein
MHPTYQDRFEEVPRVVGKDLTRRGVIAALGGFVPAASTGARASAAIELSTGALYYQDRHSFLGAALGSAPKPPSLRSP